MHILLFILIFIFAVILIIFSMFRKVLSFLFGGIKGQGSQQQYSGNMGGRNRREQDYTSANSQAESNKVFSDNEGEYVNYEEVE